MSPTTKNIEPRMAMRSGTRQPGSRVDRAWTFEYEAVRQRITIAMALFPAVPLWIPKRFGF